jgi:hypothetical protein
MALDSCVLPLIEVTIAGPMSLGVFNRDVKLPTRAKINTSITRMKWHYPAYGGTAVRAICKTSDQHTTGELG